MQTHNKKKYCSRQCSGSSALSRFRRNPTTHGKSYTKVYTCWEGIKQRCCNPKTKAYKDYGGRGIQMCERWKNSFEMFLADVGEPPTSHHSIDRIDNDGNYEPGNVRWASRRQQTNNRRTKTTKISFAGMAKTIPEWCEFLGILRPTVVGVRLRRGWDLVRAVTTPPQQWRAKS